MSQKSYLIYQVKAGMIDGQI